MKRRLLISEARVLGLILLSVLVSCGSDKRDTENYGDLEATPGGIGLQDPREHQGGYGRTQCLVCHNTALNVHRNPDSVINVDELNELIKENGEAEFCLRCHGNNGT